jgi:phosphoribosylformimino-5-aminoimidazole carboxamide ribotide isomerase
VIDLLYGKVVHGKAGQRTSYQPIQSVLADSAEPVEICQSLQQYFGFTDFYVADLNAIAGDAANVTEIARLLDMEINIWLDAGTATLTALEKLSCQIPLDLLAHVIVALECCPKPQDLEQVFEVVGPARAVFSLDLKGGQLNVPDTGMETSLWQQMDVIDVASQAVEIGFRKMIVLDVAAVGGGQGVWTLSLTKNLAGRYPDLEIISGGGVRSAQDLKSLATAGCQHALVASALHDGRINASHLKG